MSTYSSLRHGFMDKFDVAWSWEEECLRLVFWKTEKTPEYTVYFTKAEAEDLYARIGFSILKAVDYGIR